MSDQLTLSELLLAFVEANRDQLERDETSHEWVGTMWLRKNPAGKLKKAALEFLSAFENFDGPEMAAIRAVVEPLTK